MIMHELSLHLPPRGRFFTFFLTSSKEEVFSRFLLSFSRKQETSPYHPTYHLEKSHKARCAAIQFNASIYLFYWFPTFAGMTIKGNEVPPITSTRVKDLAYWAQLMNGPTQK